MDFSILNLDSPLYRLKMLDDGRKSLNIKYCLQDFGVFSYNDGIFSKIKHELRILNLQKNI